MPERFVEQYIERITPFTDLDPFLLSEGKGRTWYPVTSLYFDSADLQALFEKEAGWLSRRKIRLRTYDDWFSESGNTFLEIKRRYDFLVSKDRLQLSIGSMDWVTYKTGFLNHLLKRVEASEDVSAEAETLRAWYNLRSTALVKYRRMAFVGKEDRNLRLTIDSHLQGMWRPPSLIGPRPYSSCGMDVVTPNLIAYGAHVHDGIMSTLPANSWNIIEFKCNHSIPGWLHQIVKDMELTRSAYSKYAMVVRALRPQLFEGFYD